jgi:protein lifeguard
MKNVPYVELPLVVDNEPVVFGEYTDIYIRQKFISKVYSILWSMLLVTTIYIGICNQNKQVQTFLMSENAQSLLYIDLFGLITVTIMIVCCGGTIQKSPFLNWFSLLLFTVFETFLLGYVGIIYDTNTLLFGGLSTLFIFTGLSVYAIQTKYDYTMYGNILIILFMTLILFSILLGFMDESFTLNILYSTCGSLLFSFYIVYDTQLIVGGENRRIKYTENDYVLAAIGLYMDIINLFLFLLDLLQGGRNCE